MSFSIRLNEDERKLVDSYSKLHSISAGEAFKKALFEKIDEEFDVTLAENSYKKYIDNGRESRSITQLWSELDL